MKLLSLSLGTHDSNFCYYNGNKVFYLKTERLVQFKHHTVRSFEKVEEIINQVWGINLSEMDEICVCNPNDRKILSSLERVHLIPHHMCHSLSAKAFIPNTDVSVVIDGQGGKKSWIIYRGDDILDEGIVDEHGSIGHGLMWMARTLGIEGEGLDAVGKLMGLQSYGTIDERYLLKLREYDEKSVGAYHIKKDILSVPILMSGNTLFSLDNYKKFKATDDIVLIDWAKTVHERCGEIIINLFKKYVGKDEKVCYSGGVAQNVLWNTQLKQYYNRLEIIPHASDEGLSIGSMEYLRNLHNIPKFNYDNFPFTQSDESGGTPSKETIQSAAKFLSEGKIVAWYQGHGEVGPRALGNRSILFDPRVINGKNIINAIKNREYYRPFGASVLSEFKKEYFDLDFENPYMLYVGTCQKDYLKSITHIDGTCRVQTVNTGVFKELLDEFYKLTGCPVLLNTSLNVSGKPIAGKIIDGLHEFNQKNIDVFIHGNQIHEK